MSSATRRYDLDWLRVIAFGLLIFYHTGMLYVADWGFHYKSQYQSEFLQYVMLMINPWRMPLLFFISGIALRYVLQSHSLVTTFLSRTWRLLLPLSFGIVAIVPVQLYVEMTSAGAIDFSFGHFYRIFFDLSHPSFNDFQSGIFPHIDVNHLWYLRELWQFSLVLILCYPIFNYPKVKETIDRLLVSRHIVLVICLVPLVLSLAELVLFPESEEGRRIARGFCFFLLGYLIFENTVWWETLVKYRRLLLIIAVSCSAIFLSYYGLVWLSRDEPLSPLYAYAERLFVFVNRWVSLLAVCAYAATYLNKPHPSLRYWSTSVYPSYIAHQSLLIAACFYLTPYQLGGFVEPLIVLLVTFGGCALIYSLFSRVGMIGELMGIFTKPDMTEYKARKLLRAVLWVPMLVIGLAILF
ncbi:acyltransferase [Alteromonadaceae bacterium M269]|nr:acyltransferase [Alteromonadaceae bacterium M269]